MIVKFRYLKITVSLSIRLGCVLVIFCIILLSTDFTSNNNLGVIVINIETAVNHTCNSNKYINIIEEYQEVEQFSVET